MRRSNADYEKSIKNSPFIDASTKETHRIRLSSVMKWLALKSIDKLMMNSEQYISQLDEIQSARSGKECTDHTKKGYITTILAYLKYSGLKDENKDIFRGWFRQYMVYHKRIKEREDNNEPTERQKSTQISWDDVKAKRDALKDGTVEKALIGLYTHVPPRRQKDYYRLKVYVSATDVPKLDHNHVHLAHKEYGGYMYIKDYKTSKFMGTFFNKNLPEALVTSLQSYMKTRPDASNDSFLFEGKRSPYEKVNAYTQWSNGVFGRVLGAGVTVNTLRHSFLNCVSKEKGMKAGQREIYARQMGHSVKVHMRYELHDGNNVKEKEKGSCIA